MSILYSLGAYITLQQIECCCTVIVCCFHKINTPSQILINIKFEHGDGGGVPIFVRILKSPTILEVYVAIFNSVNSCFWPLTKHRSLKNSKLIGSGTHQDTHADARLSGEDFEVEITRVSTDSNVAA